MASAVASSSSILANAGLDAVGRALAAPLRLVGRQGFEITETAFACLRPSAMAILCLSDMVRFDLVALFLGDA